MIFYAKRQNIAILRQGIELLSIIPPECYTQRTPACYNSTVGGHFRHIIDHYMSLLHGMEKDKIDYETRARDLRIENDPAYAMAQMECLNDRLECLSEDKLVPMRSESATAEERLACVVTSVLRELEFLVSHTVHHYALIGVICQLEGIAIPKDFGMAPSTLRHQRTLETPQCAR